MAATRQQVSRVKASIESDESWSQFNNEAMLGALSKAKRKLDKQMDSEFWKKAEILSTAEFTKWAKKNLTAKQLLKAAGSHEKVMTFSENLSKEVSVLVDQKAVRDSA